MALVEIQDVKKNYGALNVLDGVSLNVDKGQVVAIIGRSGSGKSTLLRCVNGLELIQGGEIRVGGDRLGSKPEELRKLRQRVGIVFQSYNLFPHLTVLQNLTLAPKLVKKTGKADAAKVAREMLALVGLADKADAFPDQLSGGQQQRVAIARSLAMQPEVMLFDEVTSALDPELTEEVLKVMEDLAKRGMTMMLVTHEMSFARQVADVVVFMNKGKIWEIGPSEELFAAPRTQELQQFLKSNLK
jgi:polar amino acid transport system ATP-binding protein